MGTIKLYYKVQKALKPNLLEKFFGIGVSDNSVHSVSLFLTSSGKMQLLSSRDLSRIFVLIIQKLAEGRSVQFLFPYDKKEVKNKISKFKMGEEESNGLLWFETDFTHITTIGQILEEASFTTFFALIGSEKTAPNNLSDLMKSLKKKYLVIVFSLFDESIEVLSAIVPGEKVLNVAREVCTEMNVEFV